MRARVGHCLASRFTHNEKPRESVSSPYRDIALFTSHKLESAHYVTQLSASAANQYEVGRCDVMMDSAHDQMTPGSTPGWVKKVGHRLMTII